MMYQEKVFSNLKLGLYLYVNRFSTRSKYLYMHVQMTVLSMYYKTKSGRLILPVHSVALLLEDYTLVMFHFSL